MSEKKHTRQIILGIIFPLGILVIWHFITTNGAVPELLLEDVLVSLSRVVRGYLAGAILGVVLGLLMGIFAPVNEFFSLTLNALRQIAPLAWIPLLMLWFGIGDLSKEVLIAMGTFYQTMLNTIAGLKSIPKGYIEFAKIIELRKVTFFFIF